MVRFYVGIFVICALVTGVRCSREPEEQTLDASPSIGKVSLLAFSADDRMLLGGAEPFPVPEDTALATALEALGRHLSNTYFSRSYEDQPADIQFQVKRIDILIARGRPLRIATIDMVDTNQVAIDSFFQGSRGGQTTFCMLTATFLQPQLDPPLLDGLILLYNGEPLKGLDHIDLSGILTPRLVQRVVYRAIYEAGG